MLDPGCIWRALSLFFRISCLGICWGSSRTATAGRSYGWSSLTSVCSSTNPTRSEVLTEARWCDRQRCVWPYFIQSLFAGRVSSGQPSSAGILHHHSLRVGEHPQRLRLQAPFQITRLLFQIRERVHLREVQYWTQHKPKYSCSEWNALLYPYIQYNERYWTRVQNGTHYYTHIYSIMRDIELVFRMEHTTIPIYTV